MAAVSEAITVSEALRRVRGLMYRATLTRPNHTRNRVIPSPWCSLFFPLRDSETRNGSVATRGPDNDGRSGYQIAVRGPVAKINRSATPDAIGGADCIEYNAGQIDTAIRERSVARRRPLKKQITRPAGPGTKEEACKMSLGQVN